MTTYIKKKTITDDHTSGLKPEKFTSTDVLTIRFKYNPKVLSFKVNPNLCGDFVNALSQSLP